VQAADLHHHLDATRIPAPTGRNRARLSKSRRAPQVLAAAGAPAR
jgi:hypothetical protein